LVKGNVLDNQLAAAAVSRLLDITGCALLHLSSLILGKLLDLKVDTGSRKSGWLSPLNLLAFLGYPPMKLCQIGAVNSTTGYEIRTGRLNRRKRCDTA
jgi:hypothetical protein